MRRYAITEEQRDEWAMILKYLNEWVQTVNGSPSKYCTDIISGLRSLPELPAEETDGMPAMVYVREEREVGGTLRDWIITTTPCEALGVYALVSAHPDFAPAEPETCEWERERGGLYVRGCDSTGGVIAFYEGGEGADRPDGTCVCGKPITIKPGRE